MATLTGPEGDAAPLVLTERRLGSGLLVAFLGILPLGGAGLLSWALLSGAPASGNAPLVVALLLAALGFALFLRGLNLIVYRAQFTLDRDGVTGARRSLRGTKVWSEPLDAFRGILARTESARGRRRGALSYCIVLKHARDAARDVVLLRARSPAGRRSLIARFAQRLGVPVLVATSAGTEARDAPTSLAALAADGKLRVPPAPAAPLAVAPLRAQPRADGYAFERRFGGRAARYAAIAMLIGVVALAAYARIDLAQASAQVRVALFAGLLCLPLGIAVLLLGFKLVSTLEVDPTGVRARLVFAGRVQRETVLPADAVDELRVAPAHGVHIVSDAGAIEFAPGVPERALRTIVDAVLATLARGSQNATPGQVERLRKFALASLAAGLAPDQVHVKLSDLGAPAEDVHDCLRAIAEDRTSPHAGLMRAYFKLAPAAAVSGAAASAALALPPIVAPGAKVRAPQGVGGASDALTTVAAVVLVLALLGWFAAPYLQPGLALVGPWMPRPVLAWLHDVTRPAGDADFATGERIAQGFGGFDVPPVPDARYALIGARRIYGTAQGPHLRVVLENVRLEKRADPPRVAYRALGIAVAPLDAERGADWAPAFDLNVSGTLTADSPVAELPEQVLLVPTMAEACTGGCQAQLLLQVRVGPKKVYTERSPVFRFDAGARAPR